MRAPASSKLRALALTSLLAAAAATATATASAARLDPLTHAIERWATVASDTTSKVDLSRDTRQYLRPLVTGAEVALRSGQRLLALYRLSFAWPALSAAEYVEEQSAAQHAD